jgi:hypothetical protein
MAGKRMFDTVAHTQPTADEAIPGADVQTSRRPEAKTSGRLDVEQTERVAFTWRMSPEEADRLDVLVLELRRQLGGLRLTKAQVLQAMVDLVETEPAIRRALLVRLD